jgi:MFS family permease
MTAHTKKREVAMKPLLEERQKLVASDCVLLRHSYGAGEEERDEWPPTVHSASPFAPTSPTDQRERRSYIALCTLYVVYGVSFSLLVPALPGLLLDLSGGDTGKSSMLYGSATSVRYLLEFFSAPILGSLADSKGRKFVFVLALAVCACEFALLAVCPSVAMVFVTRAMSGLGDAGVAAGYAMMTDLALHNHDMISQQYGLLGAMNGLAFAVGPFVGGRLMEFDTRLCFVVAFLVASSGAVASMAWLEETKHLHDIDHAPATTAQSNWSLSNSTIAAAAGHSFQSQITAEAKVVEGERDRASATEKVEESGVSCENGRGRHMGGSGEEQVRAPHSLWRYCLQCNPLSGLRVHFHNQALRVLVLPLSLCALNLGIPYIWFMFMHHRYQATGTQIGFFISVHGLMNALAQGVAIRFLIPNFFSERTVALYGLLVVAINTCCYGFCFELWQLFVVAIVFSVSVIQYPALKAIVVSESLESHAQGKQYLANLQGAISSIRTLSIAVGSLLFTWLFSIGISVTSMDLSALPFFVGGAVYLMAFVSLIFALRQIESLKFQEQKLFLWELEVDDQDDRVLLSAVPPHGRSRSASSISVLEFTQLQSPGTAGLDGVMF